MQHPAQGTRPAFKVKFRALAFCTSAERKKTFKLVLSSIRKPTMTKGSLSSPNHPHPPTFFRDYGFEPFLDQGTNYVRILTVYRPPSPFFWLHEIMEMLKFHSSVGVSPNGGGYGFPAIEATGNSSPALRQCVQSFYQK